MLASSLMSASSTMRLPFAEVLSNHSFAEAIGIKEEASNVAWCCALDKPMLDEILHTLLLVRSFASSPSLA